MFNTNTCEAGATPASGAIARPQTSHMTASGFKGEYKFSQTAVAEIVMIIASLTACGRLSAE